MKVKELIEKLKGLPEDLEVCVWADHGQVTYKADSLSRVYAEDITEYHMETSSDPDDFESPTEVLEIS